MAQYQSSLDGLCGPYAIVNAFEECGFDDAELIFQAACSAPAARRWPSLLWDGTTFGDLQRMIKNCRESLGGVPELKVSYPFSKNVPATPVEYWGRFDALFEDRPNLKCMILGLTRPSMHWIVAVREGPGKRVSFIDTDPKKPYQTKNRSMLHPGSKNGHPNKWIIEKSELILFEVE
jgi:hypothetical protein